MSAILADLKGPTECRRICRPVQSSGDRYFEIVNANGSIQASFQKLDSSTKHALTVEIYKGGKLLTQGSVSTSYGTVTLSADATTGVAQPAQTR